MVLKMAEEELEKKLRELREKIQSIEEGGVEKETEEEIETLKPEEEIEALKPEEEIEALKPEEEIEALKPEEEIEALKPEEEIEPREEKKAKRRFSFPTLRRKSSAEKVESQTSDEELEFTDEPAVVVEPLEERYEQLSFYTIIDGYAYVRIVSDKEAHEQTYNVIEPQLSKEERDTLEFIERVITKSIEIPLESMETKNARGYLLRSFNDIISDYGLKLSPISKKKLFYYIDRDFLGYGKINVLMLDPYLEDISCDGPGIFIYIFHRDFGSLRTNTLFEAAEELDLFVMRLAQLAGRAISVTSPMLDATLPDGSRIQLTLRKEVTAKGSTFSIRRFRVEPYTPIDLINLGTASVEIMAYFWLIVQYKKSAIVSGGTAAGKTTTLNAITLFIPMEDKIVSIEDTRELNLPHPNWIPSVQRVGIVGEVVRGKVVGEIDMFDLLKAALRQRPEYIIVGEIRGEEASVLFQAMATGHSTYSTFHADSVASLVHRFVHPPINIPHMMMASLNVVSVQKIVLINGKRARRITEVTEIVGIDPQTNEILTNELFKWDPATDTQEMVSSSVLLREIADMNSMTREEMSEEFYNRIKVIKWSQESNLRHYIKFAELVYDYYKDKNEVLRRIEADVEQKDINTLGERIKTIGDEDGVE
ncbi:MAG: type II/IV secretion system ATPase subunit [Candidatus Thermoplasmatota archaeon]|nr:type II/IV secretion system ATPase subunit [Candidatus Thermoplasmatota archaeon]